MSTPAPRTPAFRRDIPWWGWLFIVFVRAWTVIMTLFMLAVAVVGVMLMIWMSKHPGQHDLTPFFTSLAGHMAAASDTLGSGKP